MKNEPASVIDLVLGSANAATKVVIKGAVWFALTSPCTAEPLGEVELTVHPPATNVTAESGTLALNAPSTRPEVPRPMKPEATTDRLPNGVLSHERWVPVAEDLLDAVAELIAIRKPDMATDRLFDFFDRHLPSCEFAPCNLVFLLADVRNLPSSQLATMLALTLRDKTKLGSRKTFFDRTFAEVARRNGEPHAHRLLDPLR